jgi:hypothetical protein
MPGNRKKVHFAAITKPKKQRPAKEFKKPRKQMKKGNYFQETPSNWQDSCFILLRKIRQRSIYW